MTLGIIALGHGGGVPGPIVGSPVYPAGNTNFALVSNIEYGIGIHDMASWEVQDILGGYKYDLIDCGIETALRLCGVSVNGSSPIPVTQNLRTVFITHCHDDHSGGLKSLAYRTKFIDGIKPTLAYPSILEDLLQKQLVELNYMNPKSNAHGIGLFYHQMPLWDKSRGPDYDVHHFHVDHNCFNHPWQEGLARFPAFGYAVKTLDGKTTIVFSGDTAFPLPMDIIAGADIVIHDVQFYNDGTKGDHVHCPYRLLRDAVPPEHRHKVWLTHTGHELPPEALADGFTKLFRNGTMIVL